MSRRRSTGRLTRQPAKWVTYDDTRTYDTDGTAAIATEPEGSVIPWFYATRMPEPWDTFYWYQWPSAWARLTLDVCDHIWSTEGKKLYGVHRDPILRDDLKDWLIVKAIEAAANFVPRPDYDHPDRGWAAYLHGHLKALARQHFGQAVGRSHTSTGQAAAAAYNRGIVSTEYLDEWGDKTGHAIGRHALHGTPIESGDPAGIIIRIENLTKQVRDIEREDRRAGKFNASTTAVGDPCLTIGCDRPSIARGLCSPHYKADRRRTAKPCSVDGCTIGAQGRGLCRRHYAEHREAAVDAGTWNPPTPTSAYPHCTTPGCTTPVKAKGLCERHYRQLLRQATKDVQ